MIHRMKPNPQTFQDAADELRPYQRRSLRDIHRAFKKHRRVLLVEFMGTGKTVISAAFIRQAVAGGGRVLILVHRGEILKQTLKKLQHAGIPASEIGVIWSTHGGLNLDAPIQLASVQTIARRKMVVGITHVVVDEAHHAHAASWKKVLRWYPKAKLLGLTATPERLDGKPLGDFFDEMILGEPPEHLIESGYLSKPEIWTRADQWVPEKLKKFGADYKAEEAARVMSGSTIVGGIPKAYKQHGHGLAAVLFAATQKQARVLMEEFNLAGVPALTLFGDDPEKVRDGKLRLLKTGEVKVLCTCDVLGEGWDYNGCRVVIMARPTASLARYMQWAGRCMRPGGASIILDHAGNYLAFDPPWVDRDWSLETVPKEVLRIAKVDSEGRVSYLEPREVGGKLVRADHVERQTVCAGFEGPCPRGVKPHRDGLCPKKILRRGGEPWRCRSCAFKKGRAAMGPEGRRASALKANVTQGQEGRRARLRKAQATLGLEGRRASARKALATLGLEGLRARGRKVSEAKLRKSPEENREIALKTHRTQGPEGRRARGRKISETKLRKSPEERRALALKSWETRRAIARKEK